MKESDIALLDRQAAQQGVKRAELIRSKLFAQQKETYSPVDYHKLVTAACRNSNLPRSQVEHLVNFLFVQLVAPTPRKASLD